MTERTFFGELKRRNVIKASAAYLALGWVVTQITATVAPMLHLPEWIGPVVLWIGIIGFPFVVMFSWVYEITPEGIKRESEVERDASITHVTARRLDFAIIGLLVLAVVLFALDRFVVTPRRDAAQRSETTSPAAAPAKAEGVPAQATGIPDIESDPSIAVLPLVNMSDDKANEYFSDGISEELLNLLAKVPKLRVIARTSSFSFKGTNTAIPEIARQLKVASVLEGSVRKSGDKVRITAQLIRASDGSHLWSETYDRELDDIFKVQDEIAAAVVAQLKIKLLGAVPTAKPVDPKAYTLLLQAQALLDRQTKETREQSESLFRQVLEIAPDETRARVALSRIYVNQGLFGERAVGEAARLGKDMANKALALDPGNAAALAQLGRLAADFELDLPAAARYYQRALELEPGNLLAINAASILLQNIGRIDEAVVLKAYRVAHDPANASAHYNYANGLSLAGRWDESIEAMRTALRLSPEMPWARNIVGLSRLLGRRDAAGALEECKAEPDEVARGQCNALALHTLGRARDADAELKALVDRYGAEQASTIAAVYAWRGEADAAFAWLDKGAAVRDPGLTGSLPEPLLASLHADPRWLPFLRRIGYAPEQLAKIEFKVTLPE